MLKWEVGEVGGVRLEGPRVLELGAGTGVMAILIRRILDEIQRGGSSDDMDMEGIQPRSRSRVRLMGDKVLATDYHPLVLDNLEKCIRLNFPPGPKGGEGEEEKVVVGVPGLETMLLDWSTFPGIVRRWAEEGTIAKAVSEEGLDVKGVGYGDWTLPASLVTATDGEDETSTLTDQVKDVLDTTWDLIIAADCVYDLSHAEMIRNVVKWTLRLPEVDESGEVVRPGGVLVSFVCGLTR